MSLRSNICLVIALWTSITPSALWATPQEMLELKSQISSVEQAYPWTRRTIESLFSIRLQESDIRNQPDKTIIIDLQGPIKHGILGDSEAIWHSGKTTADTCDILSLRLGTNAITRSDVVRVFGHSGHEFQQPDKSLSIVFRRTMAGNHKGGLQVNFGAGKGGPMTVKSVDFLDHSDVIESL